MTENENALNEAAEILSAKLNRQYGFHLKIIEAAKGWANNPSEEVQQAVGAATEIMLIINNVVKLEAKLNEAVELLKQINSSSTFQMNEDLLSDQIQFFLNSL